MDKWKTSFVLYSFYTAIVATKLLMTIDETDKEGTARKYDNK